MQPLLVFLVLVASLAIQGPARGEPAPKRVLLLYAERAELPIIRMIDSGLREAFTARGRVEVFAEYFDFARFPLERHSGALIELLRTRYGGQKLDQVVTTGFEALQFALAHREVLFPGVPITYCTLERQQLEGQVLPPDVTGTVVLYDFQRTIELALKLQPTLSEVVCIFGNSDFDRRTGQAALAALAAYPKLRVRRLDAVPYGEILDQVRGLPADRMVLFVTLMRDATGQTRYPARVAQELSEVSAAPVYCVAAHFLEKGVLGGAMVDFSEHARDTAALAVARLDGHDAAVREPTSSLLLNWNALKKWKIAASRVPAEAVVRLKPPSFWQERRGTFIGIFAVVVMQSVLIMGLLINRAMRRRAVRALAESHEQMGLAAEAAKLGMWVWDVSGDDAWITEQGRELFGISPDQRLSYTAILDRVHPEDSAAREAAVKRALDTQGEYEMEYRVQPPDGPVRWVSARGRCVSSADGGGKKLLGVSMDVTARKNAELEAAQQREELEHLSRVAQVGEMATSLAHELNQPLTAIVTNANAARRFLERGQIDRDELREILADISADGRRAGEVIRGINGMVRRGKSVHVPLDINSVINDVLHIVRADAFAHGCALASELDGSLPQVAGDAVQFQQVLLNFLINAFDVMRKTPGNRCRVEIVSCLVDTNTVEVSVRDFGSGLPADGAARVFERFFSTKADGMGMGLAIARSIIEAHSGTLGAENAEGGGARFWFRVPALLPASVEVQG